MVAARTAVSVVSIAAVHLACLAGPAPARAGDGEEYALEHRSSDLAVLGASAAAWAGLELAKGQLAPLACRWCATNALDDWARNQLLWSDPARAARASDVAIVAMPAAAVAYAVLAARPGPGTREGWWDAVAIGEAVALTGTLTSALKYAVGRERPYAIHGNYAAAGKEPGPEDHLSFWSGHTSMAFSIAAATGTVASLRGRDHAGWVWAVGMTAATAVGWLRIAGDRHHLTDVLAGAAVGTAVGIGVPRLLHGRVDGQGGTQLSLVPVPLGIAGTW